MKNKKHIAKKFFLSLIAIFIVGALSVYGLYHKGSIKKPSFHGQTVLIDAPQEEVVYGQQDQEGTIIYKDKKYKYNDGLVTILFMGIDNKNAIGFVPKKNWGESGQADAIMLAVFDRKTNSSKLINISRDTMTDIQRFSVDGQYLNTVNDHLALGWAAADGAHESAKAMMANVSTLFYGIDIDSYCALNINGITAINDALGGVTLVPLADDLNIKPYYIKKGEEITLKGKKAYAYVQYRDTKTDGSNNLRIARQKQYATALISQLKTTLKQDFTKALSLYEVSSKYICTDIDVDYALFLASLLPKVDFSSADIIALEGENKYGGAHDEFYVDGDKLKQLVIDTFYLPIEEPAKN